MAGTGAFGSVSCRCHACRRRLPYEIDLDKAEFLLWITSSEDGEVYKRGTGRRVENPGDSLFFLLRLPQSPSSQVHSLGNSP